MDVEALAPAGGGEVWVGDIGDNRAERPSVSVARVPVGRGNRDVDVPSYELVFPEGPRDAESLLADPATNQLYVISKGVFGGYGVRRSRAAAGRPSPTSSPRWARCWPIATDAAFFPDGRHIIVRNYSEAAVYSWPELDEVGRFGLPDQQQGEGIAVDPLDGTIYASSEGLHAPVLRISLPPAVRSAMKPAVASPTPGAERHAQRDAGTRQPGRHRAARGAAGRAVSLGVGAGWPPRPRHRHRARPRPPAPVGPGVRGGRSR